MKSEKPLKILFLEDVEADKELAVHELKKSGFDFSSIRVETKEALQEQVVKFAPDIIISDYSLPKYNGMQALKFIRENHSSIPFILFTGSINEETAVECMKAGADDYIIKEHLARLPFAVREVLKKFEMLNENLEVQKALIESEERFRSYVVNSPSTIFIIDKEGIIKYFNRTEHGFEPEYFVGKSMYDFTLPEKREEIRNVIEKSFKERTPQYFETYAVLNGELFWYENKVAPIIKAEQSSHLIVISSDKTEKKKNEERIRKLNRTNIVLSKINRVIVRNHHPMELLDEACKIVITEGGFLMAWIGMINPQSQKIEISASADTFENENKIDLYNLEPERNPSGLAVKTRKKVIINDVENDELMIQWKDVANKFGIKSVISIPLWRFGSVVGVFNMYSSQAGFFDDDEIRLLKELASDVSFALEFIKIDIERFNAERALIESEKDYRNLFEEANDAIIIFTPVDEIIIEVNNKACETYGFQREEMIGLRFKKITKDTEKGEQKIKELFLLKKIQNYETVQIRKDGSPIYVSVNASLINYQNEEAIQCIIRDITQNVTALEALRESEDRFRDLVENSSDLICTHDQDGNMLSANKVALQITGYTEEEVLKMNMLDILVPEHKRIFKAYLTKIYTTGKAKGLMTIQTKTGERRIWEYNNTLRTKGVAKPIVRGMVKDITEQKRAEEMRHESELRFRLVWEKATDGMRLTNEEGIVVLANDAYCKMMEKPREEIVGKPLSIVYEESKHEEILRKHQERFRSRNIPTHLERELILWNGKKIFLELSNSFLENPHQPTLSLSVFKDITERKRTEEEIKMLAFALRSINECVSITDIQDKIIFVNESFRKTYGYTDEELIGKNMLIVRSPNNPLEVVREILPATLRGGWDGEILNRKKDGSEFPIALSTTIIRGKADEPIALIGVARDITERRSIEKAIREYAEQYRTIVSSTMFGFLIVDEMGKILEVNDTYCNLSGYAREELLNISISDLEVLDEPEVIAKRILHVIETGTEQFESKHRAKYGRTFDVEVSLGYLSSQRQFISFIRDITDRKRAEEEIIAQKNRFEQLFENSPIAIALLDNQDKIIDINESFTILFGYFLDEIKGLELNNVIVPSELLPEAKSYSDQTWRGNHISKESYRRRKDGSIVFVKIVGIPVLVNDLAVGIYGMYIDLTQRKEAEEKMKLAKEKAEEMNKVKSSFFANMSHELRTPFVGIIGFAEIIKEITTDSEIANMASCIMDSSKRMTNTLNNILDLSKLELGNLELYYEPVDVEELIDAVYNSFLDDAAKKGIAVEKTVTGFTTPIYSDRSLMRNILTELVSNAVKYTLHGKIGIHAAKNISDGHETLVIRVTDTGIGIAKETQEIIWNEFRQASEGLNRSFEGTGLGLTLCKKYVELLNGKIYVESEVGAGSTFIAEIPVTSVLQELDEKLAVSHADETISLANVGASANKKILYIDDDSLSLTVVERYLSNEYSVECVSGAPQFLEKLNEAAFDCILMDINIGREISGIDLINEVKEIGKYSKTPVVAVTAYALKSDEELILSKGFSHYISKPFNKKDILNLLRKIFAEK